MEINIFSQALIDLDLLLYRLNLEPGPQFSCFFVVQRLLVEQKKEKVSLIVRTDRIIAC